MTRSMLRLLSSSFLAIATFSLGGCRDESSEPLEIERTILTDGVTVESVGHQGIQWHVITMDPAKAKPSIRHADDSGKPLRDFSAFHVLARTSNESTVWMMNAGMYHADGSPVGLCVCDGDEVSPVNRDEGQGNFFLKPNGVFYFTEQGAGIIETSEWPLTNLPPIRCATQSGPLLVQRGQLHPAIRPNSPNKLIRNGVGVRADGHLCFVISTGPVSFHDMATFLRDQLRCPDALYLDGAVSALCVPKAGINTEAKGLGPVIGLWE